MTTSLTNSATTSATEATRQFLVFALGDESYGIEIGFVQEIKSLAPITPLPNSPDYVQGVLNLRGSIIPIIDLRQRLGMAARDYDRFNVIVVIAIEEKRVGLVVDSVSDVMDIASEEIDEAPPLTTDLDTTWFTGVGRPADRLVFLLDVQQIVGLNSLEMTPLD